MMALPVGPVRAGDLLTARVRDLAATRPVIPDEPALALAPPPRPVTRWDRVPREFTAAALGDLAPGGILGDLTVWAAGSPPPNLLITGPVGVGKSHAAVAACRPHVDQGCTIEFAPVLELLERLDYRRPTAAAFLDRCMTVDLLVIDDIGSEMANEWTGGRLLIIINRRRLEGLPTVSTTNLPPVRKPAGGPVVPVGELVLEEVIGPRMFSRLVGGATVLRMTGRDRRRT